MPAAPKFDEDAKRRFLEHFAKTGRKYDSAQVAGVTYRTIYNHLERDADLQEAFEEAKAAYRDLIAAEIHRRGITGFDEPVYQKGELVGSRRVYSDRMLELHAKRHDPSYRDKTQVDMTHSGGVLVVGAAIPSESEWAEQWANLITADVPVGELEQEQGKVKRG